MHQKIPIASESNKKFKHKRKKKNKKGRGIINSLINKSPIELHIPTIPFLQKSYNFCGPGTKLKKRLERGDIPKNGLDAACREVRIFF